MAGDVVREALEIVAERLARETVISAVRFLSDDASESEHENYVLANWKAEIDAAAKKIAAALQDRARLAELEAGHAGGGAVVKPLEWRGSSATSVVGEYVASKDFGLGDDALWFVARDDETFPSAYSTLATAKAAAQADYEARILTALAPSPSAGEPVRLNCNHCSARFNTEWERVEHERESHATPPATPVQPTASVEGVLTIDDLAQEIRRVDGSHSLGAGALAEALAPFIAISFAKALASLTPAPTQGAICKPPLQVDAIPRAENAGRYLAETNDGRLLYLNHADQWQEMPNILAKPTPSPAPVSAPATEGEVESAGYQRRYTRRPPHDHIIYPWHPCIREEFEEKRGAPDFEYREVFALSNPAPGHGEAVPVAWRVRERPGFPWELWSGDPTRHPKNRGFEIEALGVIAHPATGEKPATATGKPEDQSHG